MGIVREDIDALPYELGDVTIERREELVLAEPPAGPVKLWKEHAPVEAIHFAQEFVPQKFAPPTGVYESDVIRLEWQTMDFRQPFYHRNSDVDELSYQIQGDRTLMTELGSVEHGPGDFSRIPVGTAHDNYGRKESHLLFYVPSPVDEEQPVVRTSEFLLPPFPGWAPSPRNELVTDRRGGPGGDLAVFPIDEQLLLEHAQKIDRRINILHPEGTTDGTAWVFKSEHVWIGHTTLERSDGSQYRRHRRCDEIQYQISGRRTLVTQRGTLSLEPGDFARVPKGVSFTSIVNEPGAHLTLLSGPPLPAAAEPTKIGERVSSGELEKLRRG